MFIEFSPADPDIHKAACRIAVRCRNIIQAVLREEEWGDADREFYRVAREVLEEFERRAGPGRTRREQQVALLQAPTRSGTRGRRTSWTWRRLAHGTWGRINAHILTARRWTSIAERHPAMQVVDTSMTLGYLSHLCAARRPHPIRSTSPANRCGWTRIPGIRPSG